MRNCKKIFSLILALAMIACIFAGCTGGQETTAPTKVIQIPKPTTPAVTKPAGTDPNSTAPSGTQGTQPTTPPTEPGTITVEDIKGIDGENGIIWVGNTAGTTGALATIGAPFNLGIQAALAKYNAEGGFYGMQIQLKHYDDGGDAAQSVTYMNQLVFDDEVFAVVGNFGSYAVASNLDILIDAGVPMVYAAAGNDVLYNGSAEGGEKAIFPVQPLNHTEGQMLILRAFAPVNEDNAQASGMGATKVGVLSNTDEASQTMLAGIKEEAERSGLTSKIVYQNVTGDDYSAAINAFKNAGCDTIVIAVTGSYFTTALVAMDNAQLYKPVLTTYNNASAAVLNDASSTLKTEYESVLKNIPIFAQAWLDITSDEYFYTNKTHGLYMSYVMFGMAGEDGVPGFTEEYWGIAETIFDYCKAQGRADGFMMSYNSYALAGYIAGDLFCQAMEALEASGKNVTRANFIEIMESKEYKIAMADKLSFANGMRSGVQSFALTMFYDAFDYGGNKHAASSITVSGLISIEEFRALVKG